MKTKLLSLAILAAFALPASAQTSGGSSASQPSSRSTEQQYGEGGSKRCDQLSGAEKQTCLEDEGAKTDRTQEPAAAAPDSQPSDARSAGSGDTAPDAKDVNATQKND